MGIEQHCSKPTCSKFLSSKSSECRSTRAVRKGLLYKRDPEAAPGPCAGNACSCQGWQDAFSLPDSCKAALPAFLQTWSSQVGVRREAAPCRAAAGSSSCLFPAELGCSGVQGCRLCCLSPVLCCTKASQTLSKAVNCFLPIPDT